MMRHAILIGLALGMVAGRAEAQETIPEVVRGFRVRVHLRRDAFDGELLAVTRDSVWLWSDGRQIGVPTSQVRQLVVRRHGLTPGKAMAWAGIAGAVSGALLVAACSSVDGVDGCEGFGVSWFLTWLAIGGISAATLGEATERWRAPFPIDQVRRYARYPHREPPQLRSGSGCGTIGYRSGQISCTADPGPPKPS